MIDGKLWLARALAGLAFGVFGAVLCADVAAAADQDQEVLRFASRVVAYCPGSSFTIVDDERHHTPSGSYRVVDVKRECDVEYLSGPFSLLLDEVSGQVCA